MAEQEEPRSLYDPKDLLFDDYLRVEDVRVNPDQGSYVSVEVRAETLPDSPTHWKSLRYHCLPERAPRAHDVIHVIVTALRDEPPTAEQEEAAVLRTPEERTAREQ